MMVADRRHPGRARAARAIRPRVTIERERMGVGGIAPILYPVGCQSNNATAPAPGIAPGGEGLDPRRCAEDVARSHDGLGIDPRIPSAVPGWDAPFFQAGLAGYSDAAMRIIARRHGCPACVTEALLDRTLLAGGRGFAKADLGDLHDNVPGGEEDAPLVGQIMGSEPAEMAAAALKMLEQDTRGARAYRDLAYEDITQHKVRQDFSGVAAGKVGAASCRPEGGGSDGEEEEGGWKPPIRPARSGFWRRCVRRCRHRSQSRSKCAAASTTRPRWSRASGRFSMRRTTWAARG